MNITIYHNPRCSKSRETLALLKTRGIDPEIVEYLETPPDRATLEALLKMLEMTPRELMRTKETEYEEAGLADPELSREQLIDALLNHPRLMERPIVVANGQARIGRPPERVLEILP